MTVFQLTDAEAMNRAHPQTFEIPPEEERRTLKINDLAKVCFANQERMWVQVTQVRPGPMYVGKLNNSPIVVDMKIGQRVEFEPRHVHQIERWTK